MVSVLNSGASTWVSRPGNGPCVVVLGKTLYSHGASLYPNVYMGVTLQWTSSPSRGSRNTPSHLLRKLG